MIPAFFCRKAAVFSDIHSNFPAFRACVDDAVSQGADLFLFLGDYVSDLAQPREVLELLYELRRNYTTVCLRGNRERYFLDRPHFTRGSKSGSLLYTLERLRPRDLDFFRSLPCFDAITLCGIPFSLAHAFKEDDRFYFEKGDHRIGTVFAQMDTPYLLTGHSHKQYIQTHGSKTILNPGSVGVPQMGDCLANYALLDFSGGQVSPQLRRIPYDLAATIRAQFESGLVEYAPSWAVSILYDILTGKELTVELLSRVRDHTDEGLWRSAAEAMGMKFTQEEILNLLVDIPAPDWYNVANVSDL